MQKKRIGGEGGGGRGGDGGGGDTGGTVGGDAGGEGGGEGGGLIGASQVNVLLPSMKLVPPEFTPPHSGSNARPYEV